MTPPRLAIEARATFMHLIPIEMMQLEPKLFESTGATGCNMAIGSPSDRALRLTNFRR